MADEMSASERVVQDFTQWTALINAEPHNHTHWLHRSTFFLENFYPGLAIADAYKAYKLTAMHPQRLGSNVRARQQAAEALVTCLYRIGASGDAERFEDQTSPQFRRSELTREMRKKATDGTTGPPLTCRQEFPWLPMRDSGFLDPMRAELEIVGLELRESTLSGGEKNNLGIFATRSFELGEILFKELCPAAPGTCLLDHQFRRLASPSSQSAPANSTTQEHAASLDPAKTLSRLAIKTSEPHPLRDDDLSTLTINYHIPHRTFNFKRDIAKVVDLMELKHPWHPNFDYWVILVMLWRIENNGLEGQLEDGRRKQVTAKYASFLNHSCASNVEWLTKTLSADQMELIVTAAKVIEEGDEVFVSYVDCKASVERRRQELQNWLGEGVLCQCSKCKEEAGEP